MKNPSAAPIRLAGVELKEVRHICAFFNSSEEEYRVLLPFIKDGFTCGDKAVHVVSPNRCQDHMQRLASAGIDTEAAKSSGQLEVRNNEETYLCDGRFDPDRMLSEFERMVSDNSKGQYPISRIVCHMEWAAQGGPYTDDLVEFESRVNDVWMNHDDTVICTYDLAKVGGETVIDLVRTHPLVLIGGILQRNPFYVPPDVFLREMRERRRAKQSV